LFFAKIYTIPHIIHPCTSFDLETAYEIVKDTTVAFRGLITTRSVERALHAARRARGGDQGRQPVLGIPGTPSASGSSRTPGARPRSVTPYFGSRFRGAGPAASPSLASSPWRTPGVRSRSAPGPAPTGLAETSAILADGRWILGLQGLRRRRGILSMINKIS